MRKIAFKDVILIITFLIYFIFSFFLFYYFNRMYYQNVKEKLISENNYSAKVAGHFLDAEKDTMAKEARFVVNYPIVHYAFLNNKYIDLDAEKIVNIGDSKIEEMSRFKYTEISYRISRIIGKNMSESGLVDINVSLLDKKAVPLSDVPGIDESFKDSGKENYIQYMVCEDNKYSQVRPVGTIKRKGSRLFIKGVDRVYNGEPMGVTVVTMELTDSLLKRIKNSVNKEIVILADNEVLLSTVKMDGNAFGSFKPAFNEDNILFKAFKINGREIGYSFFPVTDFNSGVIAYVGTGFDMDVVNNIYKNSMTKFIPVEIISLLLLFIILYVMIRRVFKPFNRIIQITEEIGKGNYQLESSSFGTLEFTKIMDSMEKMSEAIKSRETELIETSKANKDLLDKVYSLLNNSGEGFLSFGDNFIVDEGYSHECEVIFGRKIEGENITSLLFQNNQKTIKTFIKSIKMAMETEDDFKQKMLVGLLPEELTLDLRVLELKYRLIHNSKVMLIITDVTRSKQLEEQIREEQLRLKFIVTSVMNRSEFLEIIKSYELFYQKELKAVLESGLETDKKLSDIYRKVHTFKGLFSQLDFITIPKALHEFENRLLKSKESEDNNEENIYEAYMESGCMEAFLNDIETVKNILGNDFLIQKSSISVDEEKIYKLEKLVDVINDYAFKTEDPSVLEAINIIGTMRYVNFKSLIEPHASYTLKLAKKLDKNIEPLKIEGDDIMVDPTKYLSFTSSLIHVFRNAVDHGIESPDERVELGKKEAGTISCKITSKDGYIILHIEDDGRGIDLEAVKSMAVKKGLVLKDQIEEIYDKDLIRLILTEHFSTKENADSISGRGIGLSTVMNELEKINGYVNIISKSGKGTEFVFKIAEEHRNSLHVGKDIKGIIQSESDAKLFMESIVQQVEKFLKEEAAISVTNVKYSLSDVNKLHPGKGFREQIHII